MSLDKYISKLPEEAKEKDLFYVRPLEKISSLSKPWYSSVPIGKHSLHAKMKNMCSEAGISGHKTNHSLRATAATEMFRRGAPEKLIQERTGHRSIEALRTYERLDEVQHKAVSTMLSNAPGTTRTMTYSQHLMTSKTDYSLNMPSASMTPYMPSVNLHDLHGCTINFNYPAPQPQPTPQPAIEPPLK